MNVINLNVNYHDVIDKKTLHKMKFIFKAIEHGWTIEKNNDSYIFRKKHQNKEVYSDDYLGKFMQQNICSQFFNNS